MKATTKEERYLIASLVKEGLTSKAIAERLGWKVKTIEKWRLRMRGGQMDSQMGRPPGGTMSRCPQTVGSKVESMRAEHPGWGSKTLHCELSGVLSADKLPSISSIYRHLKNEGMIKPSEKHENLPLAAKVEAKAPHDLWQMDGQGSEAVNGAGVVSMLNVKDAASSVHVAAYPAQMRSLQSHPNTQHYQCAFRLGALRFGLPRQLQTDHASVFYDNNSKSPFPTMFFLWLVALGVEPIFSRVHCPQDQGKVEKAHQTLWRQVSRTTAYKNWLHFFEACQKRNDWLNERFPSSACGNQPPLVAAPQAKHSGRHFSLSAERHLLSLERVFRYLEQGTWWRRVSTDATVSLGNQVYYLPGAKPHRLAQARFRAADLALLIQIDKELCFKAPLKGISKEALMGKVVLPLPGTQLALPFEEPQKLLRLFESLITTT